MNDQEPTLVKSDSVLGDEYSHPAYGTICCSRVSGMTSLVGSELVHQHYVRLSIQKATKHRSLHEDRFHGGMSPIVEINLSEHQWASFVASMNLGRGVPCTITTGPSEGAVIERKPSLKEPNKHETAQKELREAGKEMTAELQSQLDVLRRIATAPGSVSKTQLRDCLSSVQGIVNAVCNNLPFHVERHKEMMEKNVQAAKSDVEGFVTGMVTQLGIESLRQTAPSLPLLSAPVIDDTSDLQHREC